jgi:RNA polymerase sigma-70 factor (ECF subfamily)
MAPSDESLAARAQSGAAEAFSELVLRFQRPVFSLIVRLVRDRALAEDLAQDAFVRAWRKLATYDSDRPFRSWMFKIAHNLAIDELRRRRPETVPIEEPESEGLDLLGRLEDQTALDPAESLDTARALQHLEQALGQLRPAYREVILLRFREGLAYEEIAEIMDLPLGTVKTHIFRARKELVEAVSAAGYGEI